MTFTPSITMKSVLEAIKTELVANASAEVHVEIAPGGILPVQYAKIRYQIEPVNVRRTYPGATDGQDSLVLPEIEVRVWVSTTLTGGEDGSYEYLIVGDGEETGLVEALETAEGLLHDYFMADEDVQSFAIIYDEPTFGPVMLADNNIAFAGSFRIQVKGTMSPSPSTPIMFSTRLTAVPPLLTSVEVSVDGMSSATVTWTTNFLATSQVKWAEGTGNTLSNLTDEDTTERTSHSVQITELSPGTLHECQPRSRDLKSNRIGHSHYRYPFTTDPGVPEILTGPTAEDIGSTSASIEWTTDVPAYHRVQYKKDGGSWTTTPWSESPSTNASVDLSGLDSEYSKYYWNVQSGTDTGNPATYCEWDDGDEAETYSFNTTCLAVGEMWGWDTYIGGGGKLEYLVLKWRTNESGLWRAQIDGSVSGLDYGPWTSGTTTHIHTYESFPLNNGTYYWRTRHQNYCSDYCVYSAWKQFRIGGRAGSKYTIDV